MSEPASGSDVPGRPATLEEALGELPERPRLPFPSWLAPLSLVCVIALIPWIVYLALTLPRRERSDNYDIAWIGFDVALWVVLAALAFCAIRRLTATGPVAAVAATMLCVDAWFDVVTTHNRSEFVVSVLSAIFVEVPLAVICGWVAVNAERVRRRAYRRLRERWQHAVVMAREAAERAGIESDTR